MCDANLKERSAGKCSIIVCLCAIRGSIDRTIYMYLAFDLFYTGYLFFILPASPFTGQQIKRKWEEAKKKWEKPDIVQCNITVMLTFRFKDKSSLCKSNLAKGGLTPWFCPYYLPLSCVIDTHADGGTYSCFKKQMRVAGAIQNQSGPSIRNIDLGSERIARYPIFLYLFHHLRNGRS